LIKKINKNKIKIGNRIGSVKVSVLASSAIDCGYEPRSGQRNLQIRKKNRLWRPCLLTDLDEMSNRYRGPSIDASCQVSVHLASCFKGENF
jgi:hypothetical protein